MAVFVSHPWNHVARVSKRRMAAVQPPSSNPEGETHDARHYTRTSGNSSFKPWSNRCPTYPPVREALVDKSDDFLGDIVSAELHPGSLRALSGLGGHHPVGPTLIV